MKNILINFNKKLEGRFGEFWNEIGDIHKNNIFWYPSSRIDVRPISLFGIKKEIERLNSNGKEFKNVDVFIYSNLEPNFLDTLIYKQSELYQDKRTKITIKELIPCNINRETFRYRVNPDYYDFAHYYNYTTRSYLPDAVLLRLLIDSDIHGVQEVKLIFLEAENFNVFEELFLKYKLTPVYFANVYEGLSWGGAGKSLTEYIFFSYYSQESFTFKPEFLLRNEDYVLEKFLPGRDYKQKFFKVGENKKGELSLLKQYAWDNELWPLRWANLYKIKYPG